MPRASHVQGSVDGLCGIYCLVHFLERVPKLSRRARTKAHAAFSELLKDAQDLGLLDASNISGGYYAADLARIFNKTASRKRLPYLAAELDAVREALELTSATELLRRVLNEEGSAIVSAYGGRHWVLAVTVGSDLQFVVKDPGHAERYRKRELKRAPTDFDGVALVPRRSAIARALRGRISALVQQD